MRFNLYAFSPYLHYGLLALLLSYLSGCHEYTPGTETVDKNELSPELQLAWDEFLYARDLDHNQFIDSIHYYLDKSLNTFKATDYRRGQANIYSAKSVLFNEISDYEKSITYADSTIALREFVRDTSVLREAHNSKGRALYSMGSNTEALQEIEKVYDYSLATKDTTGMILALGNTAPIYAAVGDMEACKDSYRETYALAMATTNYRMAALSLLNLGASFADSTALHDSSYYYVNLARQLVDEQKMDELKIPVLINLSEANVERGHYQEAINDASIVIRATNESTSPLYSAYGSMLAGRGYQGVGQYDAAITNLQRALRIAKSIQEVNLIIQLEQLLAENYELKKDYRNAFAFITSANEKEKEITGKDVEIQLSKLKASAEVKDKENEIAELKIAQLEQEQTFTNRRNRSVILLVLFGVAMAIFFSNYQQYNKRQIDKREKLIAEGKLEILRSQMNPHFIFNAFGGVQNYILKSKKIEAYNYLGKLAALIRTILENASDTFIQIEQEVDILSNYLELESMRFRSAFEYSIDIDPTLKDTNARVPSMMIQPHIENAIIHGLSHQPQDGKVKVSFKKVGEGVQIDVKDNGIGRKKSATLKDRGNHLSMSTINGNQRLNFLRKIGYENASINIEDLYHNKKPAGTLVRIFLPLV